MGPFLFILQVSGWGEHCGSCWELRWRNGVGRILGIQASLAPDSGALAAPQLWAVVLGADLGPPPRPCLEDVRSLPRPTPPAFSLALCSPKQELEQPSVPLGSQCCAPDILPQSAAEHL